MSKTTTIRKGSKVQVIRAVRGAKVGAVGVVANVTRHMDFPGVSVYWIKQADGWMFDANIEDLARA